MRLSVYYRISDKGNPKEKLPRGDKFSCLRNAVKEFGNENIHVIADNCTVETVQFIKNLGLSVEETSLGNSGSFAYMLDKIISLHNPEDFVYLLEDDYLHLPGSKKIILEGLQIGDYVTLFDHPDKYLLTRENGNHFNYHKLQKTRLYLTETTHWRETNSTTMTFACRVQTLHDNYHIWRKNTRTKIPDDFWAFAEITQRNFSDVFLFFTLLNKRMFLILLKNWLLRKKTKKLISSVPAFSTHTEVKTVSPIVDWSSASV
jgi:hypothetical protein